MRTVSSLAVVSLLLTLAACGNQRERPPAAVLYSEHGEQRGAMIITDTDTDTDEDSTASASDGDEGKASGNGAADPSSPSCTPKTCAGEGFTCGTLVDGCGGTVECGTCGKGLACTNDGGGSCATATLICKAADMRVLGSCVALSDGPRFSNGAACLEYHDSRTTATTDQLQYACDCAKGVWASEPCSARMGPGSCAIESGSSTCSRMVSCWGE
jgi:hypothetical protein